MWHEILKVIILSGAGMAMLVCFYFFTFKNKTANLYFLFVLCLCTMILLYSNYIHLAGLQIRPTFLYYMFVPLSSFFGPCVCFYYLSTMNPEFEISKYKLLTFAPGAGLFIAMPFMHLFAPSLFHDTPLQYYKGGEASWLDIAFIAATIYNAFFYIPMAKSGAVLLNMRSLKGEQSARLFLGFSVFLVFINGLAIYAMFSRQIDLIYVSGALFTPALIVFFMLVHAYPEFLTELETALDKAKYKKSKIASLDLQQTHQNLLKLMLDEELFLEEGLTLGEVASSVNIKPHQLSEFLNKYLDISFSTFINSFRIDKAKELLLEDSASVTSVAYKVGFNSKANFNLAFKTLVEMSPSEYIKKNRDKIRAQ